MSLTIENHSSGEYIKKANMKFMFGVCKVCSKVNQRSYSAHKNLAKILGRRERNYHKTSQRYKHTVFRIISTWLLD